MISVNLLA